MTIRYIYIFIVLLCMVNKDAYAQQQPIYSQYMINMLTVNPAYAGSNERLVASALFRKQWVGIPGAPQTTIVGVDMPANNNWLGLGLQLFNDQVGVEKTTGLVTSYAFKMHLLNEEDEFAIGVQAGVSNFKADYNQVDLINPYDASFTGNTVNVWLPSFGSGVYYHNANFYAGLSCPNLLSSSLKNKTIVTQSAVSAKQVATFFLTAGYIYKLNDDLELKPSVLLKATRGAPVQADFNTNLWINNKVGVGASYRTGDAIIGMIEINLSPQLQIGYSYDRGINSLQQFNKGSHEFALRFQLPDTDEEKKYYYNPRHF